MLWESSFRFRFDSWRLSWVEFISKGIPHETITYNGSGLIFTNLYNDCPCYIGFHYLVLFLGISYSHKLEYFPSLWTSFPSLPLYIFFPSFFCLPLFPSFFFLLIPLSFFLLLSFYSLLPLLASLSSSFPSHSSFYFFVFFFLVLIEYFFHMLGNCSNS